MFALHFMISYWLGQSSFYLYGNFNVELRQVRFLFNSLSFIVAIDVKSKIFLFADDKVVVFKGYKGF